MLPGQLPLEAFEVGGVVGEAGRFNGEGELAHPGRAPPVALRRQRWPLGSGLVARQVALDGLLRWHEHPDIAEDRRLAGQYIALGPFLSRQAAFAFVLDLPGLHPDLAAPAAALAAAGQVHLCSGLSHGRAEQRACRDSDLPPARIHNHVMGHASTSRRSQRSNGAHSRSGHRHWRWTSQAEALPMISPPRMSVG